MRAANNENGVVLVEFALVLVPLLLIVIGFLQFGVAMHAKINGTHLSAEGARYIAVNQNPGLTDPAISAPDEMQKYIRSRAGTAFLRGAEVCIIYPNNPETSTSGMVGDPVLVTMSRVYGLEATSGLASLAGTIPTSIEVRSETTMRLEALPTKVPAGCTT